MKRLVVVWMCIVVAAPMGLARQQTAPDGDARAIADVLVCIDIDANPGFFHDISQVYVDAFIAAGAATVATAATEVSGGSINFPPDLTAENYPVVVVLGSDNWFSGPNTIDPTDEAALAAYLDTGGSLLLVAQDYMTGAHPDMMAPTPCYGFPRDYLGLDLCYQNFDTPAPPRAAGRIDPRSTQVTVLGRAGWVLVTLTILLIATVIFPGTGYFMSDRATPTATAGVGLDYEGQFATGEGALIYNSPGTFKTVWSGVELAGAATEDFNLIIGPIYNWLRDDTPVEPRSWTSIKAEYR